MLRRGLSMISRRSVLGLAIAAGVTGIAGCGKSNSAASGGPVNLRLGHFPNLTHATALVGANRNFFAQALGSGVTLSTKPFNAGPDAVQALLTGAIDATYVGPNPTVNAWSQSRGKAVKVVAGAASGGVFFVVKPTINGLADLKGKKIATPQLGNTQDVALRYWLRQHGLNATKEGGGDVHVLPQDNATTVTAFGTGTIDGAWVPEPYASKLVAAGGKILVDERALWPGGKFVITNLLVSTSFLSAHRDVVKNLIAGQVAANAFINSSPEQAQQVVADALTKLAGKQQDVKQIAAAWKSLTFLNDPLAASLRDGAAHAEQVGLLAHVDLAGLYDLGPLNEVLKAQSQPEVAS
jgi:NitT/TauT family transport system substrate-binding protein